jgi:signal transduction histidine kinase
MPRATLVQVDVKEILINCINLFHHTDTINIRFNCTEQGECFIYADKEQLLRMFNNLLKNAVQAIPEKRKGHINVSLKRSDNDFIISIEDNGTGINTDAQHKIFSPNFTTKTGGMGLGLAIVKNIIEGINGKIWFTTESDKGTTFYISFPSSSAMAEG